MIFNVPQFIDVEDKIVGPLGWRHLFWIFGLGAVLLVLWNILEQQVFYIVAIPIAGVFMAFAFVRPYGQPLTKFVWSVFGFVFRPKVYMWRREEVLRKKKAVQKKVDEGPSTEKEELSSEELDELVDLLEQQSKMIKK
ncbi:PrgI family protein [Patescibacteria group bacterium]